jgi:hypothetical protein
MSNDAPDNDIDIHVGITFSESVIYHVTTTVTVPADTASDPDELNSYLSDDDLWIDALDPVAHCQSVNEREVLDIEILPRPAPPRP